MIRKVVISSDNDFGWNGRGIRVEPIISSGSLMERYGSKYIGC